MGKGKKGGKRMNKAQLTEMLQEFFAERPGETLSFKEIFRSLLLERQKHTAALRGCRLASRCLGKRR